MKRICIIISFSLLMLSSCSSTKHDGIKAPHYNELAYGLENANLQLHTTQNDTIICVNLKKNCRYRFWKWKSDYNWMAMSGRLINTDAPLYVFKFYLLGNKQAFYSYSIDVDKWDSDNYDFFYKNDAFTINNVLFNINNGKVKRIRKDILEIGKRNIRFIEEGEEPFLYVGSKRKANLIDFCNKLLNNDSYTSQNFIDVEILNEAGETETTKRMEISENVYVNQNGERFLIANYKLPFPKKIKHFPGDKETESIIASTVNAVVLPDRPYFLIYSNKNFAFYLIDKEGNCLDTELLKEYFIERNSRARESELFISRLKEGEYDGKFHIINK